MERLARINNEESGALTTALLACCDVPAWAETARRGPSVRQPRRPHGRGRRSRPAPEPGRGRARAGGAPTDRRAREGVRDRGGLVAPGAVRGRRGTSGPSSELLEGNRAYEERFGRVFLICATGLGGDEILAALRDRLGNDDATEAAVVADELRKIALLRLRSSSKWKRRHERHHHTRPRHRARPAGGGRAGAPRGGRRRRGRRRRRRSAPQRPTTTAGLPSWARTRRGRARTGSSSTPPPTSPRPARPGSSPRSA